MVMHSGSWLTVPRLSAGAGSYSRHPGRDFALVIVTGRNAHADQGQWQTRLGTWRTALALTKMILSALAEKIAEGGQDALLAEHATSTIC